MKKMFLIPILISVLFCSCIESGIQKSEPRYRLFETQNFWTFIQLDTATGKMWQLQYVIEGDNRGGVVLNEIDLSDDVKQNSGRFTLYPTQNMYNFILLDQIDGRSWQVQWAIEQEKRGIVPIMQ
jgi:hypothetical protein